MNQFEAISLFQKIYLVRQCEKAICEHYQFDDMKTPVHLSIGAEGIAAGVLGALPEETKIFGTYRNHALYLTRTGDIESFFLEMYGRTKGVASGKAGSMHMACPSRNFILTSAVVSTTIPVAVGAALANQYQGKDDIVAVFFGDGAVEEGVFWESLNFASLKRLKIIFVCEDNDLAIHTPAKMRQGYISLLDAVKGFKCHTVQVEGYDVSKIYEATKGVFEKMRQDSLPCVMHLPYFRYSQHVGVFDDFEAGYRLKPSDRELQIFDPLFNAENLLRSHQIIIKDQEAIQNQIDQRILKAIENAKVAPFLDSTALSDGVYSK